MLRSTISDRLRGILTDLSSFVGHDNSSLSLPVCESRDWDLFIKRVHSFKPSLWFAKPYWLSPVICARYGWVNVDIDLLRCVGCRAVLVVRTSSSFDPAIYAACQKRLKDQLKRTAHHPCCIWPSCPTPELIILAHGSSGNQTAVLEDFINKALLLYAAGKDLPAIEQSALNISESDITALSSLVRNSPEFLHDAEIPGALQSAVLLALTGWDLSDDNKAFPGCTSVHCSLCMRQPGLWNYLSINGSNGQEPVVDHYNDSELEADHEMNAVKESEHLQPAGSQSPLDIVDGQPRSCEVGHIQSMTDDSNFPAAAADLSPVVSSEKCPDLQGSSSLSQDIEAVHDTENTLSHMVHNNDETCSFADDSDEVDDSEGITDDMPTVADAGDSPDDNPVAAAAGDESSSGHSPSDSKPGMSYDVVIEEHFAELAESLGENENAQRTDIDLLSGVVEQEPGPDDVSVTEEIETEQSKNDSGEMNVCHEDSYVHDVELSVAEESFSERANILTAHDEHTLPHVQCENVNNSNRDELSCSESQNEAVDDINIDNLVDSLCTDEEPHKGGGSDILTGNMEFLGESEHQSESEVQNEEQLESVESSARESPDSYLHDVELSVAGSDVEESFSERANILTAHYEHTLPHDQCENVNNSNCDKLSCSESRHEAVDDIDIDNPVDSLCTDEEPHNGGGSDILTGNMEFLGESEHESESEVQNEEHLESVESSARESPQEKSSGADVQETTLDLTHTVR